MDLRCGDCGRKVPGVHKTSSVIFICYLNILMVFEWVNHGSIMGQSHSKRHPTGGADGELISVKSSEALQQLAFSSSGSCIMTDDRRRPGLDF